MTKIRLCFKNPDVVADAIDELIQDELEERGISDTEEGDEYAAFRREELRDRTRRWVRWGELLTVTMAVHPTDRSLDSISVDEAVS